MPAIQVDFAVGGIARVLESFKSVTKAQQDMEKQIVRSASNEARARIAGSRSAEKAMDGQAARHQKSLDKEAKDVKKAEEQKVKARDASEKRSIAIQINSAKISQRIEEDKVRAREVSEKRMLALQLNSAKQAGRIAEQSVREEAAMRKRFSGAVSGQVKGSVRGALGTVGRVGGSLAALGGGFSVADAAMNSVSAEKAAIGLSNSAYIPGTTERPDKNKILSRARSVEASTNISKKELIEGWQSYVAKSSDYKGGEQNLGFFAQLSKASGSKFGDVMDAAGILRAQNANMGTDQMRATMRNIIGQGKLGAVELPDLAKVAGKITASSAAYAGDQTVNQQKLLGLSQIAIKTAGSPEEAATVVARLSADALGHKDAMPKGTFDERGNIKDVNSLISNTFKSTGGNIGKIMDMGFNKESIKLFQALAPTYNDAEGVKKGSGLGAVDKEVAKFTNASYSDKDVEADFAAVMASSGEKLDTAFTHIRDVLEQKLTPYIEKFSEKLPELMPKLERIIDAFGALGEYITDNPLKGLGVILAAKVSADLLEAGIGKLAGVAIEKAIGSSMASAMIPVAAMAVTAAAVTIWAADDTARQKKDVGNVGGGDSSARDVLAGVTAGTTTPAEVKKAKDKAEFDLNEANVRRKRLIKTGGEDTMGEVLYQGGRLVPGLREQTIDAGKARLAALNETIKGLQMNLDIVNKAFAQMGKTAGGVPPVPNSPVGDHARSLPPTNPVRP